MGRAGAYMNVSIMDSGSGGARRGFTGGDPWLLEEGAACPGMPAAVTSSAAALSRFAVRTNEMCLSQRERARVRVREREKHIHTQHTRVPLMKPGSWRPEKCGSIADMRPGDMSTSVPSGLRLSTRFLHERERGSGRARVGEREREREAGRERGRQRGTEN
jgi:hypothetical protein